MEEIKNDLLNKIELINYKYKCFLLKKELNNLNEKIIFLNSEISKLKNENENLKIEVQNINIPISFSPDLEAEYLFEMED